MSSISLQQEISAIVKQKCLHRFLIHRISNPYSFSATRNMWNGEREMSFCMRKSTVIPKKSFGTWQFGNIGVLVNFIIQKLNGEH